MRIAHAKPSEFLVVGRGGRLRSLGLGASALLLPGAVAVTVPAAKEEACFAMTQETRDGIPLRFKGIAIYRVVDPVAAATTFNFTDGKGHERIQSLIGHVCLGELRDVVSHMTMSACIEQRKTTLTSAVSQALERVVRGAGPPDGPASSGWGIALEIVQMAQVFIVDDDLRAKLEAELRNEVATRSERAAIRMREEVELARLASRRRLEQEGLQGEQERTRIEGEKLALAQELETRRLETEAPVQQLRLAQRREVLELEIAVQHLENELRELAVQAEVLPERVRQTLEREILPLRQVPQIAESLSKVFQGASLSVYGDEGTLITALGPLLELVARHLHPAA